MFTELPEGKCHLLMCGPFGWSRSNGYEVSSRGDRRFSAFHALMPDGRSIEHHYQCDVKGYDPGGINWRIGKGKPPKILTGPMWPQYLALWRTWSENHPDLMEDLYQKALPYQMLSDCFAKTSVNQAHALAVLLNELHVHKLTEQPA